MIPDFLQPYEQGLKSYQRNCIRIAANPLNADPLNDGLERQACKFLGVPFFPVHKSYPSDQIGKPMIMVAQLNFEQMPSLSHFPEDGILQLFLSGSDWFDDDFQVIYHSKKDLVLKPVEDFSFIDRKEFEEMPIEKVHRLSFESDVDRGSSMDSQFDFLFDELEYWDFEDTLEENQVKDLRNYFDSAGHKLGGYSEFTQDDPRGYNPELADDIQVLQIDVDKHIMFGDSGVGHIFISKQHLINQDFSKAYFYWDCC